MPLPKEKVLTDEYFAVITEETTACEWKEARQEMIHLLELESGASPTPKLPNP
jgi:hypothetical protein